MRAEALQRILHSSQDAAPDSDQPEVVPLHGRYSADFPALRGKRSAALHIRTGAEWEQQATLPRQWSYRACVGRLVELSGGTAAPLLSVVFALVADAQRAGEPVAWIQGTDSTFFPPDVVRNGIDLNALVVVRVGDPSARARAAIRLLRSGAFGLVAMDLGVAASGAVPPTSTASAHALPERPHSQASATDSSASLLQRTRPPARPHTAASARQRTVILPPALLGKLGQLAQQHDTAVCCLTVKRSDWASLGSLVSLRGEAVRRRTGEDRFACTVRVLKDKRNGPGWTHEEVVRGAPGLP